MRTLRSAKTLRGENRCYECHRFRSWDDLTITLITPDTPFTSETYDQVCSDCKQKAEKTRKAQAA